MASSIPLRSERLQSLHVLLIEDDESDAHLVCDALCNRTPGPVHIAHAPDMERALKLLTSSRFDVGLLDLSMPGLSGLEALQALRAVAPSLPVVILTGANDDTLAFEAVRRGAQDYLSKHEASGAGICRAMHYAVERQRLEERLNRLAHFDPLTGLANRALFETRLEMALARARRSGVGTGMLFIDLDRFKQVNDVHGHDAGDALLKEVATRMRNCLRGYDTVARFGGDEFAVLLEDIRSLHDGIGVAQKLLARLPRPYPLPHGAEAEIGASIGIATRFAGQAITSSELIKRADSAMYRAKTVATTTPPTRWITPATRNNHLFSKSYTDQFAMDDMRQRLTI